MLFSVRRDSELSEGNSPTSGLQPIDWWKVNGGKFPRRLNELDGVSASLQPVPSERSRLFSGWIDGSSAARFTSERINVLIFLNKNSRLRDISLV